MITGDKNIGATAHAAAPVLPHRWEIFLALWERLLHYYFLYHLSSVQQGHFNDVDSGSFR